MNLIRFELSGTNSLSHGQSSSATVYYQWARPANTSATLSLYLDDDFNPANGNEKLLRTVSAAGTGAAQVGHGSLSFTVNSSNASPGIHSLFAKISALGRSRYLYAPELVTVMSSFSPPRLTLLSANQSGSTVAIAGVAGQRIVLQSSTDLLNWRALATNWLTGSSWTVIDGRSSVSQNFYRGLIQ